MKQKCKNIVALLLGGASFIFFITDWMLALGYSGTFTTFGLLVNIFEATIFVICYDYLENNVQKKHCQKSKKSVLIK